MRKLGIVGVRGALSRAKMTAHHGGVELVAACDTRAEQRDLAAAEGMAVYDDYDEMLAKAGLDSIIICTPNDLHCDMTLKAYAKGMDVFVEKPMATTLSDCDRMIEASRAAGKLLMTGFCYRYANLYRRFVEALQGHVVGEARMLWCKEFRGYWGHTGDAWRLDQTRSGGSIVEKNCHHIDIFNWAIQSRPVKVQAFGGQAVHRDSETIDHATINIEYENGVKAVLLLSLFLEFFDELEIGAVCDGGKVETHQLHGLKEGELSEEASKVHPLAQTLTVWPLPGVAQTETVAPTYCPLWPDGKYQHLGSAETFRDLNRCLTQGATPFVDGAIGRESLVICLAAETSIQEGGAVMDIRPDGTCGVT